METIWCKLGIHNTKLHNGTFEMYCKDCYKVLKLKRRKTNK